MQLIFYLNTVKVLILFSSEGAVWDFKLFGDLLADCTLATTAALLLDNATMSSSRKTCKSGHNRFRKFALKYMGTYFVPKNHHQLSLKGFVLSFFAISSFLNCKNLKSSTIRNYVSHVRTKWEKTGANLTIFDKIVISRLLKGVATLRLTTTNKRTVFLLPYFRAPAIFRHPYSRDQLIFKAVIIFGFFDVFRFRIFNKLTYRSVVLISEDRDEFQ